MRSYYDSQAGRRGVLFDGLRRLGRGRRVALIKLFSAALFLLMPAPAVTVTAQQTLFNVPSADVLDRGKVYAEVDIPFRVAEPRFSSFVPRVVVGVGGRVEVGLNLAGNIQPGADATTLVPAVKWKAYDGGENGWAFVVGNNLFIPVRNRSYRLGNYAYAEVGKTFNSRTRVTAGGYHFTKSVVAPNAQRAGGQFGFEQPVTKNFQFQADWYTGNHTNGYFTPGFAYKLNTKLTGYFGYSLGNRNVTHGNHFLYAEVGFNFN